MGITPVFPTGGGSAPSASSLTLGSPAPVSRPINSTTATITWPIAAGGTGPYTYSAVITGDSTGSYTAYISSVADEDVSLAALTNGQFLQVTMTVEDASGNTASSTGVVLVASAAAGTMTPGAFPASQALASDQTTATISFSAVGGTFVGPVTYVATVVSGPGSVSNTGTSASLSSLTPSGVTLVRLRATDSTTPTPLVADAFAVVSVESTASSPLVWQKLVGFDFRAQGTVSFASGSNPITLTSDDGRTFTGVPVNISMGSGSYTTCPDGLGASGWKRTWASTATGTYLRSRMGVPLGVTLGADDDVLIVITGKFNNAVSANSVYWQVSPSDDASEDGTAVQGMRMLKSGANTALYLRASGSSGSIITQSSTPACPLDWQDGSTVVTETIFYPRRSTRGIVYMSENGVPGPQADLGQVGTTPASNSVRPGIWGGKSVAYIQHYGSNGAANGLGAQYQEMHTVEIFRRTLA